jgi:hypothetical protein
MRHDSIMIVESPLWLSHLAWLNPVPYLTIFPACEQETSYMHGTVSGWQCSKTCAWANFCLKGTRSHENATSTSHDVMRHVRQTSYDTSEWHVNRIPYTKYKIFCMQDYIVYCILYTVCILYNTTRQYYYIMSESYHHTAIHFVMEYLSNT